jgi:hypothetical protein
MRPKSLVFSLLLTALSACVTGGGQPGVGSTYANEGFQWRDFSAANAAHAALADTARGEALYMVTYAGQDAVTLDDGRVITGGTMECLRLGGPAAEDCYNAVVRAERSAGFQSRAALVRAGEQAIRAEGRCDWSGYDADVDAQARAIGQLAAEDDNRFFFVRLVCR